jgi:hypothetical protein
MLLSVVDSEEYRRNSLLVVGFQNNIAEADITLTTTPLQLTSVGFRHTEPIPQAT